MTRDQKIRIAMIVCAMIVACAVILSMTDIAGLAGTYVSGEKYTAGDTEIAGTVSSLDIHWTSGKVTVEYHRENTVLLRETSDRALKEDQQMRWLLDGNTLRVQYMKSGLRLNTGLQKELTVTLPEGMKLDEASFSLTSGDLFIPALKAEKLVLDVTSGDVTAAAEAERTEAHATSGALRLTLTGEAKAVKAGTTSGTIRLEAEKADSIVADSTSGTVEILADEAGDTKIGSTSGTVMVTLGKMKTLSVSTTSGRVTAALPADPGYTADITTVSGRTDSTQALTRSGSKYTCGDGSADVRISTVSGDVRLEAAE